jgi:Domain of unknown function (DUF4037)
MTEFVKGLELSRLFFDEAVRPVLEESFPSLRYAAALLGTGSEVLGFDTEMSTDHGWGPRLDLFLEEAGYERERGRIRETLRHKLPHSFRGYPTSFTEPDPDDNGTQQPDARTSGPVDHKVEPTTPRGFILDYLDFDIRREIEPADWLTFPEQKLRTITSGAIFHDRVGLEDVRRRFAYYPDDVWLYQLGSAWARVGQEEHLMGRAGMVGDEIGSAVIGARLVRDLMRLCFLTERTYAPYPKWLGTAFKQLRHAEELSPHLRAALSSETWQGREEHLSHAYRIVAAAHNALGITDPLPTEPRDFFGRPFRVIELHGFARATLARIRDERVRPIAERRPIGGLDLFSDSTDLAQHACWRATLRKLYE